MCDLVKQFAAGMPVQAVAVHVAVIDARQQMGVFALFGGEKITVHRG